MGWRTRFAALLVAIAALPAAAAPAPHWITSWAASPLPVGPALGPTPATPSFANQTIRQVLRLSAGGKQLRVRFTNEYGTKPLKIGAATVALVRADGSLGPVLPLTFAGQRGNLVPAGAPMLSDPVALATDALAQVSVSLYLPEDTGPCTCHSVGVQDAFVSESGDQTMAPFAAKQTVQLRAFLSGVEVDVPGGRTIVAFGDSITDGVGSSLNQNHRWPDQFIARLQASRGRSWGIANQGISGNRVLDGGAGDSALSRFDRDVLSQAGATHVVIFEGVNDLGISYGSPQGPMAERFRALQPKEKATAERLIAGYRQLIARAHAHGIKVIGATIAPYEGATYWSPEGEAQRQAVNAWIRGSGEVDGIIDFDAALRDPAHPAQIKDGLHAGDHLHGSDAGYAAMAGSIDLGLFR
jgi:lysophospholipase L1-like esterase